MIFQDVIFNINIISFSATSALLLVIPLAGIHGQDDEEAAPLLTDGDNDSNV